MNAVLSSQWIWLIPEYSEYSVKFKLTKYEYIADIRQMDMGPCKCPINNKNGRKLF